ncbi:hypothetical protein L0Z72_03375 [candidate division KSB1 bacterium]|nr:hypothetical protein [candidate division KSB1 bacterium]
MSIEKNAPQVKIFNLLSESIKLLAQNLSRSFAIFLLISVGGLLAADILALILKRMIHFYDIIAVVQWLLKLIIIIATAWTTVYLMHLPAADRAAISINNLFTELKNRLPGILKTFGAVVARFSVVIIVGIVFGLVATLARTPAIFLIILPLISIFSIVIFVQLIFWIYLTFDNDLKPGDIPNRSSELAEGHGWKIFFTMIVCGILISIVSVPLFLLYPRMLESDRSSAVVNFAVDFFRDPGLFVLFYYILLILGVIFQTVVFMKFYDRLTEPGKTQLQATAE